MDRVLVLVRHGQSEWNVASRFTGLHDPGLTDHGVREAREAGRRLRATGLRFDLAYASALIRAWRTCALILDEIGQPCAVTIRDAALNEQDLGALAGLDKDAAQARWGRERLNAWRRSYDVAPPGGESLKDTAERVGAYHAREILPRVLRGERVLVVAHRNSLRALAMILDGPGPEVLPTPDFPTAVPVLYRLRADAGVASWQVLVG